MSLALIRIVKTLLETGTITISAMLSGRHPISPHSHRTVKALAPLLERNLLTWDEALGWTWVGTSQQRKEALADFELFLGNERDALTKQILADADLKDKYDRAERLATRAPPTTPPPPRPTATKPPEQAPAPTTPANPQPPQKLKRPIELGATPVYKDEGADIAGEDDADQEVEEPDQEDEEGEAEDESEG